MKTLLEAIQAHPYKFISTLEARADTTPSPDNKFAHESMACYIYLNHWDEVEKLILDPMYRKPLEGVVFCLDRYSDIDNTVWHQVVDLFNEGKFV